MSKYILYTYQFSPIKNRQSDFMVTSYSDKELMEHKQEFFSSVIECKGELYCRQNKKFAHKILFNSGGIMVFRIANSKSLFLEQNFHKSEMFNSPSCLVIIDNRYNIQRIAIEEDKKAFTDTDVVKNILLTTYKKVLAKYGLDIIIQREYQASEFWNIVKENPYNITLVRFEFSYPNLPRLQNTIRKILRDSSENTNSKLTTIEYKAAKGESLDISENDDNMHDLSRASADGGDVIKIKLKNARSMIQTGNTTKSVEFEQLELAITNDLFDKAFENLVTLLNQFKDVVS